MHQPTPLSRRVRVGGLQIDLDSGEVTGNGARVRLQVQSLELLKALLERPGAMVGREELRQRLWPEDTFVDFDHGLNAAVRRLRETLGDSADTPRFVETIPRKGYRLVAPIDGFPAGLAAADDVADASAPQTSVASRSPVPRTLRWRHLPAAIGLALIVATGAWLAHTATRSLSRPPSATFDLDVPTGWNIGLMDHVAVSPDSRYIAFTAAAPDQRQSLWLRPLNGAAREVPGSEGAMVPFWSPDSAQLGFFANGFLKTLTLADGRVQTRTGVAPPGVPGGAAAWTINGDILFMPLGPAAGTPVSAARLRRLNAATGAVQPLASSSTGRRDDVDFLAPYAIRGTDAFTFVRWNSSRLDMTGHIGELGTSRIIDLGPMESRIVVTDSGHAVFARNGTLVAQRLDTEQHRLVGAPVPLAQDVAVYQPMLGHFSASSDVIVYLSRRSIAGGTQIALVDRNGVQKRTIGDVGDYGGIHVSPDGTRLAVARRDPVLGTRDIWVHELDGRSSIRVTFDSHDDVRPVWVANGRTILFSSDRSGTRDIYRKDPGGAGGEEVVFSTANNETLNAASADGQFLVYDTGVAAAIDSSGRLNKDLMVVSLNGSPRVRALAATPAYEGNADVSRDGMLVAYEWSETDRDRPEVFVEPFPEKGERQQVTTNGASEPMWRADGRELFFLSPRNELCAVDVDRSGGRVHFGPPRVLFKLPYLSHALGRYAPLPDGQSFVMLTAQSPLAGQRMTVLVNWRSTLPE